MRMSGVVAERLSVQIAARESAQSIAK